MIIEEDCEEGDREEKSLSGRLFIMIINSDNINNNDNFDYI